MPPPTAAIADRGTLAIVKESAYATVPAGPPTLQNMRITRHGLKPSQNNERSKEMRPDRQTPDLKRVGVGAAGPIDCELSYASHEEFILASIGATAFNAAPAANTGTYATSTSGTITGTGVGTNLTVGMFAVATDFSSAGVNRFYKIIAASADSITVDPPPSASLAGATATVQGLGYATNGTTLDTFVIEEERQDLSNEFMTGLGFAVNKWSLAAETQALITQTFETIGKSFVPASATVGDGTNTVATETEVMGTVDEIVGVVFGVRAAAADIDVSAFSFGIENNIRERVNLGDVGPDSLGFGKFIVTGSMTAYFSDKTLVEAFTNATDNLSFALIVQDSAGNTYIFDFPRLKFTDGGAPSEGENTDTMSQMTFEAIMQLDEDQTFYVHKLTA